MSPKKYLPLHTNRFEGFRIIGGESGCDRMSDSGIGALPITRPLRLAPISPSRKNISFLKLTTKSGCEPCPRLDPTDSIALAPQKMQLRGAISQLVRVVDAFHNPSAFLNRKVAIDRRDDDTFFALIRPVNFKMVHVSGFT